MERCIARTVMARYAPCCMCMSSKLTSRTLAQEGSLASDEQEQSSHTEAYITNHLYHLCTPVFSLSCIIIKVVPSCILLLSRSLN